MRRERQREITALTESITAQLEIVKKEILVELAYLEANAPPEYEDAEVIGFVREDSRAAVPMEGTPFGEEPDKGLGEIKQRQAPSSDTLPAPKGPISGRMKNDNSHVRVNFESMRTTSEAEAILLAKHDEQSKIIAETVDGAESASTDDEGGPNGTIVLEESLPDLSEKPVSTHGAVSLGKGSFSNKHENDDGSDLSVRTIGNQ